MENYKNDYLQYSPSEDGIAVIMMDAVNEPTNLFSWEFIESYAEAARRAIADDAVQGVIVTSAKRDFMAGADLRVISNPPAEGAVILKNLLKTHELLREIEKSPKPFVAAINGNAYGGGFELALTCNRRIALDGNYKFSLPEVQIGVFPGGGGTQRLPYLTGIANALAFILQPKEVKPQQALKDNLIDEVVAGKDELMAAAKRYIQNNPSAVQPWDDKKYKIPGGGIMTPNGMQTIIGSIGLFQKETHGNYPGGENALSAIYNGLQLPMDRALEVEARYFVKTLNSPVGKNMIRTLFFAMNDAKKGKSKPQGFPEYRVNRLGILGAGMMGAGIANVSAAAGMQVVLKDVTREAAEKGKNHTEKQLNDRLAKGKITPEKARDILGRINPVTEVEALKDCDFIIEAVFENPQLKAQVTRETEAVLGKDKIFGSNTSTLPITELAKASERPANFIGIHFFSPVEKMPLVEIIVGKETSDRTLAATIDFVTQIKKVPIVVNDSPGFFTSRVFGTYTGEGALLLTEGVAPALIENVARRAGMPVGPLAVSDEVSMTLMLGILKLNPNKQEHHERLIQLYQHLAEELQRPGKKQGKGFYDYPAGEKKKLWQGLAELYPANGNSEQITAETIQKRLLHIMALESCRCLDEGVLNNSKDGDLGSILGIGFPPYTGGVFSYIDTVGIAQFVTDCDAFRELYGVRWQVPDSLRERTKDNRKFY